jgi:hypothetical protein
MYVLLTWLLLITLLVVTLEKEELSYVSSLRKEKKRCSYKHIEKMMIESWNLMDA